MDFIGKVLCKDIIANSLSSDYNSTLLSWKLCGWIRPSLVQISGTGGGGRGGGLQRDSQSTWIMGKAGLPRQREGLLEA